jgi:hypothetical protein
MIINFWMLLFGHFLGDYFFQTNKMAINKVNSNKWCAIHCLVYTMCIVSTIGLIFNPLAWIIIFLTHYPIDRYSLAKKYMELKGGPDFTNPFAPIIYCVIDNTTHIVLMYGALILLGV